MSKCPVCHKEGLQRTRRKPLERKLSYIVPVRRYVCLNHACRWTGLQTAWGDHPLLSKEPRKAS